MPTRRTPTWITLGGAGLALTAGYVNAVGFVGAMQHGVTHVTGQVTRVGIELAGADLPGAWRAGAVVVWFFAGAVLSGALIRRPDLSAHGRRYGVALLCEAGLLLAGGWLLARGAAWGDHLVAMAAGLQNGLATSYSGAVVRTTHLTGIATDLGILVGHTIYGEPPDWARLQLLASLFAGFLLGGALGAVAYPRLLELSLLPAVAVLCLGSVVLLGGRVGASLPVERPLDPEGPPAGG